MWDLCDVEVGGICVKWAHVGFVCSGWRLDLRCLLNCYRCIACLYAIDGVRYLLDVISVNYSDVIMFLLNVIGVN